MSNTFNELLESGAHFGHLKRKWNPAMAPYISVSYTHLDVYKRQRRAREHGRALTGRMADGVAVATDPERSLP